MRASIYIWFLVFFGLVLSLSFGVYVDYQVRYLGSVVTDGANAEWGAMPSRNLFIYGTNLQAPHYFKAAQNGAELCAFFRIYDSTDDGKWDYFLFSTGNFFLYFSRDATIYTDVIHDTTPELLYSYSVKELTNTAKPGWDGEFCLPYSDLGITAGSTIYLDNTYVYVNDKSINITYAWPSGKNTGRFFSNNKWTYPGWCDDDDDCDDSEFCSKNNCIAVQEGSCGYVSNHAWHEYECCDDSDCAAGKVCSNYTCEIANACSSDSDCAAEQYCAPTAVGDKCLAVKNETGCGYILNHSWFNYECCDNDGCADDRYCGDFVCQDVQNGTCGYISGHVWHGYECCEKKDCSAGNTCEDHECVPIGTAFKCEGDVELSLLYADDKKITVSASISGLKNCDGAGAYVRKDSCVGQLMCSAEVLDDATCTFPVPSQAGTYVYLACVDINGNGLYEEMEFDIAKFTVAPKTCISTGCIPANWSNCLCEAGTAKGQRFGNCTDNCMEEIMKNETCECVVGIDSDVNATAKNITNTANETGKSDESGALEAALNQPWIYIWVFIAIAIIIGFVLLFAKNFKRKGFR